MDADARRFLIAFAAELSMFANKVAAAAATLEQNIPPAPMMSGMGIADSSVGAELGMGANGPHGSGGAHMSASMDLPGAQLQGGHISSQVLHRAPGVTQAQPAQVHPLQPQMHTQIHAQMPAQMPTQAPAKGHPPSAPALAQADTKKRALTAKMAEQAEVGVGTLAAAAVDTAGVSSNPGTSARRSTLAGKSSALPNAPPVAATASVPHKDEDKGTKARRNVSAFDVFRQTQFEKSKIAGESFKLVEKVRQIGLMWKDLPEQDKAQYKAMAEMSQEEMRAAIMAIADAEMAMPAAPKEAAADRKVDVAERRSNGAVAEGQEAAKILNHSLEAAEKTTAGGADVDAAAGADAGADASADAGADAGADAEADQRKNIVDKKRKRNITTRRMAEENVDAPSTKAKKTRKKRK
mmetsp:Transcript_176/g.558  ORF Transcript_176/g.558 Transcript_176/m.558 type:complete len:409 (+) Transcript_176:352-1578(+)